MNSPQQDNGKLLSLVQKHLIEVDNHGYVEGEDDVVATKELQAHITKATQQAVLRGQIKELRDFEKFTHNGRGTILWEMDELSSRIDDRIKQLQAQLQQLEGSNGGDSDVCTKCIHVWTKSADQTDTGKAGVKKYCAKCGKVNTFYEPN